MGKLNQSQREIVGSNCISAAVKNNARSQLVVYTTGKQAGLAVKGALSSAYPNYKFYAAENQAGYTAGQVLLGIFTLGAGNAVQAASQTWKNFSVKTGSNAQASALVQEINDCIYEYQGIVPDTTNYVDDEATPGGSSVGSSVLTSSNKTNTITYAVIGAVAVIILLLLWDRKKK